MTISPPRPQAPRAGSPLISRSSRRAHTTTVLIAIVGLLAAVWSLAVLTDRDTEPGIGSRFEARYVFWGDDGDLHVYDVTRARTVVLHRSAATGSERTAMFPSIAAGQLRWFEGTRSGALLRSMPVEQLTSADPTGSVSTLARVDGWLQAVGSAKDGRIAVLVADAAQQQRVEVWGTPGETLGIDPPRTTLWTFPPYLGRGLAPDDATTLAWSRDGARLLVVNTYVDTAASRADQTLLVLDRDGDARWIREGTNGVWIDDTQIAYQPYRSTSLGWMTLDISSGRETPMEPVLRGATAPAVSPDRARLAVERWDANEILVGDLDSGSVRALAGAAPRWFDDDTLLVSEMDTCERVFGQGCPDRRLAPTGRVVVVDLDTNAERFLSDLPGIGGVATPADELTVVHHLVEG